MKVTIIEVRLGAIFCGCDIKTYPENLNSKGEILAGEGNILVGHKKLCGDRARRQVRWRGNRSISLNNRDKS